MPEHTPVRTRGRPRGGKKAARARKARRVAMTTPPVMGELAPLRSRGRPRGGASGKPRRNAREMVDLYDTIIPTMINLNADGATALLLARNMMKPNADEVTDMLRARGIDLTPARYEELLRHIRAGWRKQFQFSPRRRGAGSRAPLIGRTSTYQFA